MRKKGIVFVIISLFMIVIFSNINSKAGSTIEQKSIYTTSYEIGGTNSIGAGMIGKYFDSNVEVSNINDIYLVLKRHFKRSVFFYIVGKFYL